MAQLRTRIGLDVGGTNTDAVLMTGRDVVGWVKTPTTGDVETGIFTAISELLERSPGHDLESVGCVMIGTTHFTNALVEKRGLSRVAAVRVCLPANTSIPVGEGWPDEMKSAVDLVSFMVHGGSNFNGEAIAELDPDELQEVAASIERQGIRAVSVSGAFSPVAQHVEIDCADLLRSWLPGVDVCISSDIGRLGLLERENASILNASLMNLARHTFAGFENALARAGLDVPLFISQNDGTVMSVEYATRYPVRTLASGPTNSMRGAAFLSGVEKAVVIDVGGTTSDAGALVDGFPRDAAADLSIEGVRTNFRMPDVVSIGLGGGSLVRLADSGIGVKVGPRSVGYELTQRARVFGGRELTATDVAVAAGLAEVGDQSAVEELEPGFVEAAVVAWHAEIDGLIRKARGSAEQVPVVLVGGGAILIDPARITAADECQIPPYSGVANAVGAAIPQVSGEIDRVVSFSEGPRDEVLTRSRAQAIANAIAAGADEASVVVVDEDVITLNYLSENSARVRIRAVGDLPFDTSAAPRAIDVLAAGKTAGGN